MYLLFGDSDFTARLAPALMGTRWSRCRSACAASSAASRAFAAAALLAFGPTYLYFSRFAREDIYFACAHARADRRRSSASSTEPRSATSPR